MTTEAVLAPAMSAPRRSHWRTALNVVETVMAVVVSVVGVLALIVSLSTHFSRYGQYTVFKHPVLVVVSGSMAPAIRTGDLIVDAPVTAAQVSHLRVGQIITFRDPIASTKVLTHRIYAVRTTAGGATAYVTKGDANNAPDATPVPAGNVLGLYDYSIPRGGYLLNALHRPLVLGLLLASPLLWFISGPLIAYGRKREEPEE